MAAGLPPALSASQIGSFAYFTVRDRLPVILTKVIDTAHRRRHDMLQAHGESGAEALRAAVGQLSEMRYQMTTDKPLGEIEHGEHEDIQLWKEALQQNRAKLGESTATWFKSAWLLTECFMYRKIVDVFHSRRYTQDLDPFQFQKEQSFVHGLPTMFVLAEHLCKLVDQWPSTSDAAQNEIEKFLMVSLWGNQYDLSISSGEQQDHGHRDNPFERIATLKGMILLPGNLDSIVTRLLGLELLQDATVHIVLDNAGMELFSDLCLAEVVLSSGLAKAVVFHAKCMPWFVSDTTSSDFSWTLEMLRASDNPALTQLGHKWHKRMEEGTFILRVDRFWTLPHGYSEMKLVAPELYAILAKAKLLIFKGDLNYRKLVGDLDWPVTTDYVTALRGFDLPHCALRTLKSPLCVGITDNVAAACSSAHKGTESWSWMCDGSYAIVTSLC